jgi:glycosyltransferase involved in cell wall biosynthesis
MSRFEEARGNSDIPPCLSVVMPAYNEADTIGAIVPQVLAQRPVRELIVVDDGSTDGTWAKLEELAGEDWRVRLLRHTRNQGKGAALRDGLELATSPYVIIQDADLEYDPREYHLLLNPVLSDRADVVLGSRFAGSPSHRVLYYWHAVGNRLLTTLSNMCTNLNLTDMEACYKLFRREVLEHIRIEEPRFGFEPEIVAKVSRLKLRIYEVAISYYGRTYEEGKKITWRDGVSALRCIVRYNFRARAPAARLQLPSVREPVRVRGVDAG